MEQQKEGKGQVKIFYDKPTFYYFFASKLREKKDNENKLKRKEFFVMMKCYKLPKPIMKTILKEMNDYGIIRIVDKQNLEILV